MADNKINVGGRLHSIATGNVLAGANEILDDSKNKKQNVINAEVDIALADRYTKEETYNKNELDSLITTPDVQYVTVTATEQTTDAMDVLPATGAANTIYRVGNWDGSKYTTTVYSEYAWNGSTYVPLNVKENGIDDGPTAGSDNLVKSGGVFNSIGAFDISELNATENPHTPAKYTNLSAALNALPVQYRKGGMSVKFVQSSDNKYVQYRLMADEFTTDTTQWAIAGEGVYVENPEWVYVLLDRNSKILYGIKADGQPYWGDGVPKVVRDYVDKQVNDILGTDNITEAIDSLKEVEKFLSDFKNSDTLKALLDTKANKTDVDNTVANINADIADKYKKSNPNDEEGNVIDTNSFKSVTNNPEYFKAFVDNANKLIEAIGLDGVRKFFAGIEVAGNKFTTTNNPEYKAVLLDKDGKIIDSIDDKGIVTHNSKHIFKGGIEDATGKIIDDAYNHVIDKSSDLAKVLREKGDMVSSTDWSDKESLEIPEPRCAYINITSSDGTAVTWPTSKTANKKYWMQFWDMQGNYFKKRIILNAQGSSSMGFIKKNGAVDFCNDEWIGDDTFKIKFGNWLAFDSFHLKAYYTDFFKGVSVMAYKLADEVELSRDVLVNRPWKRQLLANYTFGTDQTNSAQINDLSLQLDNEAKCHPDGFPCIVYLDNEFYGIYAFSIKKHRDNYHMNKGTAEHIHLDGTLYGANLWMGNINWTAFEIRNPKNLYYKEAHNGTFKYDADIAQAEIAGDDEVNAWIAAGKLPDGTKISSEIEKRLKTTAKVKNYIIRLSKALATIKAETDTTKQKTLFESYFDVPSLVDYEIVQMATGDTDSFGKNWQWITLDGNHWSVCEYDKDMSFGGFWTGAFTQDAPSQGGWAGNSMSTPMGLAISLYRDDIISMWKELTTDNILTADNIISIANDWIKRIGTDNFKKEYKKWSEAPCCRADLVDTKHWTRSNGWKSGVENNTYDNTKSYAIGDTCYYGFGNAYKFTAIAETVGNPPLTGHYSNYPKELGYYDSFWRLVNYIKQRISVENTFINSL